MRVDDPGAGIDALLSEGLAASRVEDGAIRVELPVRGASEVTRILAERGIYLSELRRDEVDLETVFLALTKEPPGEELR